MIINIVSVIEVCIVNYCYYLWLINVNFVLLVGITSSCYVSELTWHNLLCDTWLWKFYKIDSSLSCCDFLPYRFFKEIVDDIPVLSGYGAFSIILNDSFVFLNKLCVHIIGDNLKCTVVTIVIEIACSCYDLISRHAIRNLVTNARCNV